MKFIPWAISVVLVAYITVTTLVPRLESSREAAYASQSLEPTWTPVIVEKVVEIIVTATPTVLAFSSATPVEPIEIVPTSTAVPDTPIPTATPQVVAATIQSANLRTGPSTNYDIAGGLPGNTAVDIVGRNATGDWYQLANGSWIFGQLVGNAPQSLPIVEAPPLPTAVPTPVPPPSEPVQTAPSGGLVGTIHVDSWRFEISEVKVDPGLDIERQSIIFLGYVFNEGMQTDTFGGLYTVVLQDSKGRQYQKENRVIWAARDKYGAESGASINPEARRYIALGYDVPASEKTFTLVPGSLAASWGQNVTVTVP